MKQWVFCLDNSMKQLVFCLDNSVKQLVFCLDNSVKQLFFCLDNSVKQTVMEKYHTNATAVIMTFDTIQTEVRTLVFI